MATVKAELPLGCLRQSPKAAHTARVYGLNQARCAAAALTQYGNGSMTSDCNGYMAMLCLFDNSHGILCVSVCMCVYDVLSCRLLQAVPLSCG